MLHDDVKEVRRKGGSKMEVNIWTKMWGIEKDGGISGMKDVNGGVGIRNGDLLRNMRQGNFCIVGSWGLQW